MDPVKTFLGQLLLEEITPVVMVLSTPLAEQACGRNDLNFVEMLRPFSLNKIDVPVRTASDQPYRLQMFKLRLFYAFDISQKNDEVVQENTKQLCTISGESIQPDLTAEPPELEDVLKLSESDSRPPWIQKFNKELCRSISFSEHETFDHPVMCLIVVSSKDDQPINKFVDIFNTDQLPSILNEGVMDPKILKYYILLHDNQDGAPELAANILMEMRSTFGSNDCKLLCINSGVDELDELKENPWMLYEQHASLKRESRHYLSNDDANEIRTFMQDLVSKHIIPHMEQKICILNQQVSATRKGFKNQIKNLWWRKGKDDTPETSTGPMYTFSSIESQIRLLGDYAFMLRDYDLALSNYRLLSTDYKLDKAWKRYASVQEMMGLAYFMLDQLRKDSEYCMENAFNTYLRLGSSGLRNATRCGIWWAEMLRTRSLYKDAAIIYSRISNEEPALHAAVMLEQASYCYLFSSPPMLRKYGFNLIQAGNRYYISDQRQHAIRTYRNAFFVYKANGWRFICDHVYFNIGRWFAFLGIFDIAVTHMLKVLDCGHQSLLTQELFVGEFLQTAQNLGKKFEVQNLQLPTINVSTIKVIYEDHRTYARTSDKVSIDESLWHSLEEDLVPSMSINRPNWLESHQRLSASKKYKDSPFSVLGESIKVELELENPLHIPISLSGISLICEHPARPEGENMDHPETNVSSKTFQDDCEGRESYSCREPRSNASLSLSELNLLLSAGESKRVLLEVTPNIEGLLKIVGIRWALSESVVGYSYFDSSSKKELKKGRKERKSFLNSNLIFAVIKGLPKLESRVYNMPKKVYAGDLRLIQLELKNNSEYRVKNMKMAISHPRFLVPGCLEDLNFEFPNCLENKITSGGTSSIQEVMDKSKSLLFTFDDDVCIEGWKTFTWPFWFHSGHVGRISLYLSLYYEIDICPSNMAFRVLRMHYDLEVLPSLDVSYLLTPCPSKRREFLVRMDIVNRTFSKTFDVYRLSTFDHRWKISSLTPDIPVCPSQMLIARQTMSCFFKLKENGRSNVDENAHNIQSNYESLCAQDITDTSITVHRTPLSSFLPYERFFQEPYQEVLSTVDFILLSRVQENMEDADPVEDPKLLSIYSCHSGPRRTNPISWLLDGPKTITHNFSSSFCEADFTLSLHNGCKNAVAVSITTFDTPSELKQSRDSSSSSDPDPYSDSGGWYDVSLESVSKISDSDNNNQLKKQASEGNCPFVWCGSCSTQVKLKTGCSAEVPLRICIFSPGTYNLSNYELQWKTELASDSDELLPSGTSQGHPFYLTVLQSSN